MKLQIITPGFPQGNFAVYLATMVNHLTAAGFDRPGIQNPCGSDLVAVRTAGLVAALEQDPTHILWIDSDMVFPPHLAHALYERSRDVVACNVVLKDFSGTHYATNAVVPEPDGSQQISSVGKQGVERVHRIGLGIMMTRANVYRRIAFPWFGHQWYFRAGADTPWRKANYETAWLAPQPAAGVDIYDHWRSSFEDWWLCERFAEAGIDVWVDHDLSAHIGHRGSCVFYPTGAGVG